MKVVVLAVASLLAFAACPPTGVVCRAGTTPCGAGCIDATSDPYNCGSCGSSCAASQICNQGVCQCQTGTTACGGVCAVLAYDARNCGACGLACDGGVCEASTCKAECTLPNRRCGDACVNPSTDLANCGACGQACLQGQACRAGGCTFDAVAACFSTGQVVGFDATTLTLGTRTPLANNPQSLAPVAGGLLAADGLDKHLYQAAVGSKGVQASRRANLIGAAATQVLVDGLNVYVVNSADGTLQVLQQGASGADVLDLGADAGVEAVVALGTVGALNFGPNTYPEGVAVAGGALWVPLYGGYGAGPAAAGQTVARVTVSAGVPTEVLPRVSLAGLDLQRFDGGAPVARPWTAVAHRGAVYVVLNNLNPDSYAPEGPGLLARFDPANPQASLATVSLGGARCLNPQWAAEVGDRLAVSCGGRASYDPSTYALTAVSAAGLALLDAQDQLQDFWSASCAGGADAGCTFFLPGRFAVHGNRLLLGDQNAGKVVVLDVTDAGLGAVRGVATALPVCPLGALGVANVGDVVSLP